MTTIETKDSREAQNITLAQQLERAGWALFLIMIGCLALLPSGWVPEGTWLTGTGLIMIGLNVVRYFKGIPINGFANLLGIIALAIGVSSVTGVELPVLAILLATIGLQILLGVLVPGR